MDSLTVGEAGCVFLKITKCLLKNHGSLVNDWRKLARQLDVDPNEILKLKSDQLLGKSNIDDIVVEVLTKWRLAKGSCATLENLLECLRELEWIACREALITEFELGVPLKQLRTQKYLRSPQPVQEFLQSLCHDILILLTLNCTITMEKITENESNIKPFNVVDFLQFVSSPAVSKCNQTLLINCEGDHRRVEKRAKLITQEPNKSKLILVTSNSISTKVSPSQENEAARGRLNSIIAEDKITWDDLTPLHQDQVEEKVCKMYDIFQSETISDALETLEGQFLIDIISGRKPSITKDNFPAEVPFYVPRRVVGKCRLTNDIFKRNCQDIFLFIGIERYKMAELVTDGEEVGISSDQIRKRVPTCRYIILEEPVHFMKICQATHCPVHLISYENETFSWIKSRGGMYAIQKSVDIKILARMEEMELVDILTKSETLNQPVCVSDTAGMGKTILLAKIGRIIRNTCPEKQVVFAVVSELVYILKAKMFSTSSDQEKLEMFKDILIDSACENPFGKCLLKSKLESGTSEKVCLELLLDGFDEVSAEDFDLAYECLSFLTEKLTRVRLWVTTRPHFLHALENHLQTLGYNIEPFDTSDQVRFLEMYWGGESNKNPKVNLLQPA